MLIPVTCEGDRAVMEESCGYPDDVGIENDCQVAPAHGRPDRMSSLAGVAAKNAAKHVAKEGFRRIITAAACPAPAEKHLGI